jgi:squalene synthase HpnC
MTIGSFSYTAAVGTPPRLPDVDEILGRATSENFPVASVVLPKELRRHLLAFYGFARLVDFIGDEYSGDRVVALDWLEGETRSALDEPVHAGMGVAPSDPRHALVVNAAASARELGIDPQPLFDLIEANRRDQELHSYATVEDLLGYCRLSANPVGRLVLGVFGVDGAEQIACSDALCTGLQLVEHWQDVQEDARAGRVYLPDEDLRRFGVDTALLAGPGPATPQLRALMVFEAARARAWLDRGLPLLGHLAGRPRWAVAGFWAGGQAALDALARRDFDVLRPAPRPSGRSWARHMARVVRPAASLSGKP